MKNKHPIIINIEGNDGTGKATLTSEIVDQLEERGYRTKLISFPKYITDTGKLVRMFLEGELYGRNPTDCDPYISSLPYTINRLEYLNTHPEIFTDFDVLVFNRSYLSNFFYQAVKFTDIMDQIENGAITTEIKFSGVADILNWLRVQGRLEIDGSQLQEIPIDNFHSYYILAKSINLNHRKMSESRPGLDKHETNLPYLKAVEQFAHANPIHIYKEAHAAHYAYKTMQSEHGMSTKEIAELTRTLAASIILDVGCPYHSRCWTSDLTKK